MDQRIVTAETEEGRLAIQEVMKASYEADLGDIPPAWARALLADGVPVSFILVDPNDDLAFPQGKLRTAFIGDVATREDRRGEGHFRAILEDTFAELRAVGVSAVTLHGEAQLYRRFGFSVYAHHAAWFLTPELVERRLGAGVCDGWERSADLNDHRSLRYDLLLLTGARVYTLAEAAALLRTAAALAKERGRPRIVIVPASLLLDSCHCPVVDTPLAEMVLACGGEVSIQGADPEGRPISHADWIKVLDAQEFVREAVRLGGRVVAGLPQTSVQFNTEVGSVGIRVSATAVEVLEEITGAPIMGWPSAALAQLVLGYNSAAVLAEIHRIPLPDGIARLLDALFPRQWRLSLNESWIFAK